MSDKKLPFQSEDTEYGVGIKHTHLAQDGSRFQHIHEFQWGDYAKHALEESVAHPESQDDQ